MSEKFCLRWNDFEANAIKSFRNLRNEEDFYDVTLVSSDQHQLQAHKLVLSASSEYFKKILTNNGKHSNTLLCLEGISTLELTHVLDYIYNGEVQIYQDNLDRFLLVAQRFQLEGLIGEESDKTDNDHAITKTHESFLHETTNMNHMKKETKLQPRNLISSGDNSPYMNDAERTVIPMSSDNLKDIDMKIWENIEKDPCGMYRCTVCGKMDKKTTNIKEHVEKHVEGLSFPCNLCEKVFRSRHNLRMHCHRNHK